MFTVRRPNAHRHVGQPDECSAADARQAARRSGRVTPGAHVLVTTQRATVRFQVDAAGRIRELSRYEV